MAAFHQHRAGPQAEEDLAGSPQVVRAFDGHAGQGLGLGRVGRQQGCASDEQALDRRHGVVREEPRAALRDHNRIDHRRQAGGVQELGDELHDFRVAEHAGLDHVGADVIEDGARLGGDDVGRQRIGGADAQGVLHGDGGDGARRIAAQGGDSLDVRLHPGPATGIGSGDDQDSAERRHGPAIA